MQVDSDPYFAFLHPQIRIQLLNRRKSNIGGELFFWVLNQQGKEAVSEGYLRFNSSA